MLLGKICAPDWLSKGIPDTSKMDATAITELAPLPEKGHYSIASDGKYIYIHNVQGLHKVGSGYGETVKVINCVFVIQTSNAYMHTYTHIPHSRTPCVTCLCHKV